MSTQIYTCAYCSADDMSTIELLRHLALTHNLPVRTVNLPEHSREPGAPMLESTLPFAVRRPNAKDA